MPDAVRLLNDTLKPHVGNRMGIFNLIASDRLRCFRLHRVFIQPDYGFCSAPAVQLK